MSSPSYNHETLTFLVRLWREVDAHGHGHWRARVEHLASQEVGYLENLDEVMRFVERWMRPNGETGLMES